MHVRILASLCAPLIVTGLLISVPAGAQSPAGKGKSSPNKKWRTPWGDPDLQGSWSNTNITPLERPAKWAGREFMTEQERAEEEKKLAREEGGSYYDTAWTDGRTSLIYDPPNGKMPPTTRRAKRDGPG